ncbi:MAG: metallophosphoesterase [Ruminococcus sp.]|nr:metallophosphoesterase [Ruminococcus sp.]
MKKFLSVILSLVMVFALCNVAFAADADTAKALKFNDDGKFKIMQINDTQDIDRMNKNTVKFLKAALEGEKPDLVVIPGDMLSDMFTGANEKRVKNALKALGQILNDAKVPFAATPGNHDHDLEDVVSIADQMATLREFEYCVNGTDGCDPGTYNLPIMSSDGSKMAMNVYVMDSNNKSGLANGYTGVYPEQVEWYKQKSDELKAANGGEVVPSLLFQHVPVKEIYQFLNQVKITDINKDSVFSLNDYKWYNLNPDYIISDDAFFGEAPCSEMADHITGQYEAWLEKGDIIGAFFAHDHVNNFVGKTDEGIILGYNGGTGFRAYGNGDQRSVRVFEIDENDVSAYTTRSVYYKDLCGSITFYPSDIMTPAIFGEIFKFFLRFVGIGA